MSQTDPCYAGTAVNAGSGVDWANPTNAVGSNFSTYSEAGSDNASVISKFLRLTNFGLSIPEGSTIDGISARIYWGSNDVSAVTQNTIQLVIGGSETGNNKSIGVGLPNTPAWSSVFGGVSDTWGMSPTRNQVVANDFGISIKIAGDYDYGRVYAVELTGYYTPGSFHERTVLASLSIGSPLPSRLCSGNRQPIEKLGSSGSLSGKKTFYFRQGLSTLATSSPVVSRTANGVRNLQTTLAPDTSFANQLSQGRQLLSSASFKGSKTTPTVQRGRKAISTITLSGRQTHRKMANLSLNSPLAIASLSRKKQIFRRKLLATLAGGASYFLGGHHSRFIDSYFSLSTPAGKPSVSYRRLRSENLKLSTKQFRTTPTASRRILSSLGVGTSHYRIRSSPRILLDTLGVKSSYFFDLPHSWQRVVLSTLALPGRLRGEGTGSSHANLLCRKVVEDAGVSGGFIVRLMTQTSRLVLDKVSGSTSFSRTSDAQRLLAASLGISTLATTRPQRLLLLLDKLGLSTLAKNRNIANRILPSILGTSASYQRISRIIRRLSPDKLALSTGTQRATTNVRRVQQNLKLSTRQSRNAFSSRKITGNLGGKTTSSRNVSFFRVASSSLAEVDAIRQRANHAVLVSEHTGLGDSFFRSHVALRKIAAYLGLSTTQSRSVAATRIARTTLALRTAEHHASTAKRLLRSSAGLKGTHTRNGNRISRLVHDTLAAHDNLRETLLALRQVESTLGIPGLLTKVASKKLRKIQDTLAIKQELSQSTIRRVHTHDTLGVADRTLSYALHLRRITEKVGITDDVQRALLVFRRILSILGVTQNRIHPTYTRLPSSMELIVEPTYGASSQGIHSTYSADATAEFSYVGSVGPELPEQLA